MTQIKICGLSTPESVTAAIENGATHVGFVFFEKSPRHIDIETASYLASYVPDYVQTVGLFVNPDDDLLKQVIDNVRIDLIQLHGDESSERVQEIKETYGKAIMKALPVDSPADLEIVDTYTDHIDYFLFDAKPDPTLTDLPGGNGLSFDWMILEGFNAPKPYFLAGGLTPENVETAITKIKPYGVDVSSGVESTPGVKDTAKIASFLRCTKSA
ncbi:MAG: phosphoribosylanthranilate isomerase [Alphaproteobacteria bacterium]|nr:phosphoribosylanthranilate isomerase [Alphaproteobacteria bacterium]